MGNNLLYLRSSVGYELYSLMKLFYNIYTRTIGQGQSIALYCTLGNVKSINTTNFESIPKEKSVLCSYGPGMAVLRDPRKRSYLKKFYIWQY
jgi:hypothetical protein